MATLPLESELLSFLGGDDKARVMARYCGFDGLGGATLQAVGAEFGITAERVRQILGEVIKRGFSTPQVACTLDQSLACIAGSVPGWADEIESKLHAAGLTAKPFRIEGVMRAAELFGREPSFSVTETSKARLVHRLSTQALDRIVRTARRAIERTGIATIRSVAADLVQIVPEVADGHLIGLVLALAEDCRWLDRASEWFWLPEVPRNPLLRRVRKILSVANPVRLSELCAGLAREHRVQSYSAPPAVLSEWCRQVPGLRVEGDNIFAEPGIEPCTVLSEMEAAILDVLVVRGRIMRCADLASVCLKNGMNRASFYSCLSHSPVVVPVGAGRIGVIGTRTDVVAPDRSGFSRRSRYLHAKAQAVTLRHLME
jgi:hypothetical protein